jgi:hypothetical protein
MQVMGLRGQVNPLMGTFPSSALKPFLLGLRLVGLHRHHLTKYLPTLVAVRSIFVDLVRVPVGAHVSNFLLHNSHASILLIANHNSSIYQYQAQYGEPYDLGNPLPGRQVNCLWLDFVGTKSHQIPAKKKQATGSDLYPDLGLIRGCGAVGL